MLSVDSSDLTYSAKLKEKNWENAVSTEGEGGEGDDLPLKRRQTIFPCAGFRKGDGVKEGGIQKRKEKGICGGS